MNFLNNPSSLGKKSKSNSCDPTWKSGNLIGEEKGGWQNSVKNKKKQD